MYIYINKCKVDNCKSVKKTCIIHVSCFISALWVKLHFYNYSFKFIYK